MLITWPISKTKRKQLVHSNVSVSLSLSVKIEESGLDLFYFSFYFYFLFDVFLYFLFLEQLGLELISHTVTSVTTWWHSHKTDHETWKNEVEGSRIEWRYTTWTPHVGLMLYTWSFRVGCTVVSTDH